MDETYIAVKGIWKYLYRAVDEQARPLTSCGGEARHDRS